MSKEEKDLKCKIAHFRHKLIDHITNQYREELKEHIDKGNIDAAVSLMSGVKDHPLVKLFDEYFEINTMKEGKI